MKTWIVSLAACLLSIMPLVAEEGVETLSLDVYATDRYGTTVTDLTRADFELLVDGRPVEPAFFHQVTQGRMEGGDAEPLSLVVFIDNLHLVALERNRALEALEDFAVERLDRGDQVMLVAFDGELRIHQELTRDPSSLRRAMVEAASAPAYGHLRETLQQQVLSDVTALSDFYEELGGSGSRTRCPSHLEQLAKRYTQSTHRQVHAGLAGLSDFVATMAGLPGRKAIVHLSGGIPFRPGAGLYEILNWFCSSQGEILDPSNADISQGPNERSLALGEVDPVADSDVFVVRRTRLDSPGLTTASLFSELTRQANTQQVPLFTLQASQEPGSSEIESRRPRRRTLSQRAEEVTRANLRDSLKLMSEATGATLAGGTKDLGEGLDRISRDLDHFYTLGYEVYMGEQPVKVRLEPRRPGLRLRYRNSAAVGSLEEELPGRTRAALIYAAIANPLNVALDVGATQFRDGKDMVPIRLRIPLENVTLQEDKGDHSGLLGIFVAQRDSAGRFSEVRAVDVTIAIPEDDLEEALEQDFLYTIRMLMDEGDHEVAVGVYDHASGLASFLTEEVRAGSR